MKIKYEQCSGEGQGDCALCEKEGRFAGNWMCFLYRLEGYDGIYCWDCVQKIQKGVDKDV